MKTLGLEEKRVAAVEEYAEGKTITSIINKYGLSEGSVIRWALDAGYEKRRAGKTGAPDNALIVAAYMSGFSASVVGKAHGVTPEAVLESVRDAGYAPRTRGQSLDPVKVFVKMVSELEESDRNRVHRALKKKPKLASDGVCQ